MMKYKTKEGEVLQGGTSSAILKAYQRTSKFDMDRPFEEYLNLLWERLDEWEGRKETNPMTVLMVLSRLIENGFLSEIS